MKVRVHSFQFSCVAGCYFRSIILITIITVCMITGYELKSSGELGTTCPHFDKLRKTWL